MRKRKKLIIYLLLILLISLAIFWLGAKISPDQISVFVNQAGIWAPIVFIALTIVTYIIAPLSGTPIFFAGYALFKEKLQVYIFIAHTLSAVINFWIARLWGRNLVTRLVGKEDMAKVDQFVQNYGLKMLVFLRLSLLIFHDFISFASGLTKIKFIPYFVISVLGFLPWFLVWHFFLFDIIRSYQEFTLWFFASIAPFWIASIFFFSKIKRKASKR